MTRESFYDHVNVPVVDECSYDIRVTGLVMSLYAIEIKPDYLLLQTEPDTDAVNEFWTELNNGVKDAAMIKATFTDRQSLSIYNTRRTCALGFGCRVHHSSDEQDGVGRYIADKEDKRPVDGHDDRFYALPGRSSGHHDYSAGGSGFRTVFIY
jgi:hypothetical protein